MYEQLFKTILSPYYYIKNLGIGSKVVPRVSKFIGFGINLFNDYTAIEGNKEEMWKIIKDFFNKTKDNEQNEETEETEENNYFNNFDTILEMEKY